MMLRRHWHSLRTRIIIWSFVPTVIILFAVALVTFYAYQRVTEDLVTSRNRELTRLSASQLTANLAEYSDLLVSVARSADIYKADPGMQRGALLQYRNRLVVFDSVLILDTRGRVTAADPPRPELVGVDWSDRAYYRQMLRTPRPLFSNIEYDERQQTSVVIAAVPITGDQGELRGLMAGMFRLGDVASASSFYAGIVKLRIGERGSAYLVDGNGKVIYHSNASLIGRDLSGQPVVQQVVSGKVDGLRTRDFANQDVVATFAPVPGTPWGLVIEETWSSLISSSQGYQTFLILLLALGVVVPVGFVLAGVRRITRPIEEIITAAGEVSRGKFGQTITVTSGDELEELAQHFNHMSAQLQAYYANLERRVADRTRELSALNTIAAVVSGSLEIEEILHHAVRKTLEVTEMEAGAAFRLDRQNRELILVAHAGLSDSVVQQLTRFSLGDGEHRPTAERGQPLAMPVSDLDEGILKDLLAGEGWKLTVSTPLIAKGKTLGVMNLGTRTMRPLTNEEMSLLAGIGHQVGVALENAHLYEEAEQAAAAAERSRLARDLHDAVTQTLFSASLIAEVLPRLWDRNPDEGRRRVEELRQLTRGALAEMRTLLLELRPTALTEAMLGDLLRQLAEAITGRARVPISVEVNGQCPLPPDVQIALYRIAQEALNNVAKHSGASHATVGLRCELERVELHVGDDGRGFNMAGAPADHLGLRIMRERAEAIGARLEITSQPGQGTQVSAVWQDGESRGEL